MLDTHVLVWLAAGAPELGLRTSRLVDRSLRTDSVAVSAFSFWEIAMLVAKGRLSASPLGLRAASLKSGIVELPLDGLLAIASTSLSGFHGDPADRIIAATALTHGARLVTADARILGWKGGLATQDART